MNNSAQEPVWISNSRMKWIIVALFSILYVSFNLSPSSYGCGLKTLGAANDGLIAGHCQGWRSDEYVVLTPYFQKSVLNGFGSFNEFSPYKERLISFFALPTLDWGLAFRPQVWLFHILSPAKAYSAYWLTLMLSMLASSYYLLRFAGLARPIAASGSLLLFFSQFIQLWWTMNAGVFAFIAWTGVVMLANLNFLPRFVLVFLTTSLTLFSFVYPPFLIGGALAVGAFVLAVSPHRFRDWRFLLAVGLGVACAALCAAFYYWDLYVIMKDTVYPGRRMASGGGVNPVQLLGHILPYITTAGVYDNGADSSAIAGLNPIEIGVIGSWLPLLGLVFAERGSLSRALRANLWFVSIMTFLLVVLLLWMTTGWLDVLLGKTPFNQMPPRRALYGFGIAFLLMQLYLAPCVTFRFTPSRFFIFGLLVVISGLLSAMIAKDSGRFQESIFALVRADRFDYVVFIPLVIVAVWSGSLARERAGPVFSSPIPLLFIASSTSILTFGLFNPVQSTSVIFQKVDTPITRALEQAQKVPTERFLAVEGGGALLSGLGYNVIGNTLLYPQLAFFRKLYPDMPESEFLNIFNRYGHITVSSSVDRPTLIQGDLISLPSRTFTMVTRACLSSLPPDFDAKRYLELQPDVAKAGMDAGTHYLQHGCKENRNYR